MRWGRGYGTAAAGQALEYAFAKLKLRKVFLRFLADNIGARKSYEHVGFRLTDRRERVMTRQGERECALWSWMLPTGGMIRMKEGKRAYE